MMRSLTLLFLLLIATVTKADDFEVDGIGYTVLSLEDMTVSVSSTTAVNAVIPNTVTYKERTFTVTAIDNLFDSKCKSTTLTINSLVKEVSGITFYGSGLQNIYVDDKNPYFTAVDGILYDKEVTRLISFPQKKYLQEYTMPNTVKSVDEYCMGANHYLATVIFSDAIETLPQYVFYGCSYSNKNKCKLHLPNKLTTLVKYSLSDLPVYEIEFPENLSQIEDGALKTYNLEKVSFPNSATPNLCITGSSNGFLYDCSKLKDVYITDESPDILNDNAFKEGQYMSVTVHVPSSSLDLYKSAEGWKKFWTIVDENGNTGIKYKLTYIVDSEEYKTYEVEYGVTITPEEEPTKDGYTFSGWSEIPETMPAHDVTVTGIFTINKYKLTYTIDGKEYKTYELDYGASITPEVDPTKEGYTFLGWSEIPETMPAHDVTVTGTFSINSYNLTYMIDDKVYKEIMYEYGATITPEPQPEGDYATFEWIDLPLTMPAHDVVVYANYTSGIIEILMTTQRSVCIYSPNGKKLDKLQKGLNIVVLDDGTVKKVVVK